MNQIKTILIISQQIDFCRRMENGFSCNAYRIETASGSDYQLQAKIERISPDLIIIDVAPPELTGIELSLQIRCWSPVPQLMFSTLNTQAKEVRILDVHSDGWLSEPLSFDLISVRVSDLLANPVA